MAVSLSIKITQNSQNISNNTSNVTVAVSASWTGGSYNTYQQSGSVTIDGTKYSFTSPFNTSQTTSGSTTIYTRTQNITHNNNGKKTLSCSATYNTGVSSGTITASASKTLTTIPRTSTLEVYDMTLGASQTIKINRASSSFVHTVWYTCGNKAGTIGTALTSSTTLTWTPPLSLAEQNQTGTIVPLTISLATYSPDDTSTPIGTVSDTVSGFIPATLVPAVTATIEESGTAYKSEYGAFIQNLSKVKVTLTPTTAYSPIASYRIEADGQVFTKSTATFTITNTSSGTMDVLPKVTDKRGRSSPLVRFSESVIPYTVPTATKIKAFRCNQNGTANEEGGYVKVTFSGSITELKNSKKQNSPTFRIRWREAGASSWTSKNTYTAPNPTGAYSLTNITHIFEADKALAWEIQASTIDNFKTVSITTQVSVAFALMNFRETGMGMGIGRIASADQFEIGIPTLMFNTLAFSDEENRTKTMDNIVNLGINPITDPKQDTPEYWGSRGFCYASFTDYALNGQPMQYGILQHLRRSANIFYQMFYATVNQRMWFRSYSSNVLSDWIECATLGGTPGTAVRDAFEILQRPVQLFEGTFNSGSIYVTGLSNYALLAFQCSYSNNAYMFGSPTMGLGGYLVGNATQPAILSYRYSRSENTLTIDTTNRGIYGYRTDTGAITQYNLTRIYGIIRNSDMPQAVG